MTINFINCIKKKWHGMAYSTYKHHWLYPSTGMHVQINAACTISCIATSPLELPLETNHRHFRRKKVSETLLKLVHLKMHKQDIK